MSDKVLQINDLKIYYPFRKGLMGQLQYVKAVDGVTLDVKKGEVLGIVGESGCGKSTLGKAVCRLIPISGGQIILNDKDITTLPEKELRPYRKDMQMIFQDPYASLNPRMTVHDIIAEPMIIHNMYKTQKEIDEKVVELLNEVGMDAYHAQRYPHEFSGGQRQRIGIARALATEPDLIIADEPVSALDVLFQGASGRPSHPGSDESPKRPEDPDRGHHPQRPQPAQRLQVPYALRELHGDLQQGGAAGLHSRRRSHSILPFIR